MIKHPWYVRLVAGLLGLASLAAACLIGGAALRGLAFRWVVSPCLFGLAALFLHAAVYGIDPAWIVPDDDEPDR